MIKIEMVDTYGFDAAIRGMRNPMNSWEKSDSALCKGGDGFEDCTINASGECPRHEDFRHDVFCVGKNDLALMRKLVSAGSDHSKFMRMINVTCDITSHHTWWAEFDTYKVGTVRNSCSKMHKIHVKEFVVDDFSTEGIGDCGGRTVEVFLCVLNELERLRRLFNENHEKKYWRAIIELLPMGFNIKATVQLNYAVLRNMYHARKNHKLDEWRELCMWVESLPYARDLICERKEQNDD